MTHPGPHHTGDPAAPIRLIPRSGSDPDLRDDLNGQLERRIIELAGRCDHLLLNIRCLRHCRGYAQRARRVALKREHREAYGMLRTACYDFEIAIRAAFDSASEACDEAPLFTYCRRND